MEGRNAGTEEEGNLEGKEGEGKEERNDAIATMQCSLVSGMLSKGGGRGCVEGRN